MRGLFFLINVVFTLYSVAIIVRALLSWLPGAQYSPFGRLIYQITEPVLAPLRRFVPMVGNVDITPMVALLILWLLESLVVSLLQALLF